MKALIIIDMQKGLFIPETPRFDADGVINRINQLADLYRSQSNPVIFIQHDGTGSGHFEKGSEDWEIIDELVIKDEDLIIDKYANDMFYRSDLQNQLALRDITQLTIMGCATDFCVEASIQNALTRDYHITVVADGHTTGDKPYLMAEKIIEHYNFIWQNLIPTRGSLEVKTYEEVKAKCGLTTL